MELFPSVMEKIARTAFGLVSNHPFVDGNKRIGVYVLLILLELNQIHVEFADEELIRICLDLACGQMDDKLLLEILTQKEGNDA
jgi:death-on-curing protein